jgi:hypothetical protein
MLKIDKKTIKKIKRGDHDTLIDAIEFLIDTHNEDKFNEGYSSALSDLSVRSYRLAEHLYQKFHRGGKNVVANSIDDLAKVIEDYYTEALKR